MQYSVEEIKQYAAEEDVKFIRMAFCDAAGRQKNIAIMPEELDRAFRYGIAIDGCARTRPPSVCCPGGRSMDGWCGCSAP